MRYTRTPLSSALPFDLGAVKDYARITHSDEDSEVQTMALTAANWMWISPSWLTR